MKHGIVIDENLNDFTKLFAYLFKLDEDVRYKNKSLLLNFFPDDYENFIMTFIHEKEVMGEVTIVLLNHEFRCWDKESTKIDSVEALTLQQGRYEK
ncbi:hypothetical protein MA16_Dca020400 [Dendrobium catenatum]|uniref:Uncharacterized protein n=1 Tax=Dendrobium catenatum TaxID=906689 RepID=A0A2I0VVN5_9ASPA|nr:hypothetical protein MA16_Dca020400 [Dendrobium catenatum]